MLLCVGSTTAQDICPAVVKDALNALDTECSLTGRNQACYGNISLKAIPRRDVTQFKFDTVGDIANLDDINALKLDPLDAKIGQWGLVMMRVQADIPDTLPGQNITFILFGDVTIQNAARKTQNPMQAFYLKTGVGNADCAEAPESGLMVQTPSGVKEVTFNINGVDVEMGSTVVFQAQPGKRMRVKTIEGKARLKIGNKIIPVVQGSEYTAAVNENLQVTDAGSVTPYEEIEVENLPTQSLSRPVQAAKPLTQGQIEEVQTREDTGQPLCSDETGTFLPPCTKPLVDANGHEAQIDASGNVVLTDEQGQPLFYDYTGTPVTSADDFNHYLIDWIDPIPSETFGQVEDPAAPPEEIPIPFADVAPLLESDSPTPDVPSVSSAPNNEPDLVISHTSTETPTDEPLEPTNTPPEPASQVTSEAPTSVPTTDTSNVETDGSIGGDRTSTPENRGSVDPTSIPDDTGSTSNQSNDAGGSQSVAASEDSNNTGDVPSAEQTAAPQAP